MPPSPTPTIRPTTADELRWLVRSSRTPAPRSMLQFAEAEIVLPDGPYKDLLFSRHRQPWSALLLEEMSSGRWARFAVVGCVQSGKTLLSFVIPSLYHTQELREKIVAGVPSMDMSIDKWRNDLLPAIQASRYRAELPTDGAGSRGGRFEEMTFRHGAKLKFMSGGGGDEKRSGYSARVAVVTEVDKMDERGGTSRETDHVAQIAARTLSYDDDALVYLECTVSIEEGRIWREYTAGTASRLFGRCPACGQWVSPEREQLTGWQEAKTAEEARRESEWTCPGCSVLWEDAARRRILADPRLVHRGQTLDEDGRVQGDPPDTRTLGFRWNAFWNGFWSTGSIGVKEWTAARAPDEDAAEREMLQFFWSMPWRPPLWEASPLTQEGLASRIAAWPRGLVPAWADRLTVGVDVGKWLLHWVAVASRLDGTCHVAGYDRVEVPADSLGVEAAVYNALRRLADVLEKGFAWQEHGGTRAPDQVIVDARYAGRAVYQFCRERAAATDPAGDGFFLETEPAFLPRYLPSLGYGASQEARGTYHRPARAGKTVRLLGEEYHVQRDRAEKVLVLQVNADHWKSFVWRRLETPVEQVGAMTVFQALPREHMALFKHLTAESETREFVAGRGPVTRWKRLRAANHFFDATSLGGLGGHVRGVRLLDPPPEPEGAGERWFRKKRARP